MMDIIEPQLTQAAKFAAANPTYNWLATRKYQDQIVCFSEYPVLLSFTDRSLVLYNTDDTNPVCYVPGMLR